jgi:hypothetical protein
MRHYKDNAVGHSDLLRVMSLDAKVWANINSKGQTLLGSAAYSAEFAQIMMTGVGGTRYQLRRSGTYDICITFSPCDYMDFKKAEVVLYVNENEAQRFEIPIYPDESCGHPPQGKFYERHVEVPFTGNKWDVLKTMVLFAQDENSLDFEIADIYNIDIRHRSDI